MSRIPFGEISNPSNNPNQALFLEQRKITNYYYSKIQFETEINEIYIEIEQTPPLPYIDGEEPFFNPNEENFRKIKYNLERIERIKIDFNELITKLYPGPGNINYRQYLLITHNML